MKKNKSVWAVLLLSITCASQVQAGYRSKFLGRVVRRVTQDPATTKRLIDQGLSRLGIDPNMVFRYLDQFEKKLPSLLSQANTLVSKADTLFDQALKFSDKTDMLYQKVMPLIQKVDAETIIMALKDEQYINKLPAEVQSLAREAQNILKEVNTSIENLDFKQVANTLKNVLNTVEGQLGNIKNALDKAGKLSGNLIPAQAKQFISQLPSHVEKLHNLLDKLATAPPVSTKMIVTKLLDLIQQNPAALQVAAQETSNLVRQIKPYTQQIKDTIQKLQAPAKQLIGQARNLPNTVRDLLRELKDVESLNDAISKIRGKLTGTFNQLKPQLKMALMYVDEALEKASMFVGQGDKVNQIIQKLNLEEVIPANVREQINNLDEHANSIRKLTEQLKARL